MKNLTKDYDIFLVRAEPDGNKLIPVQTEENRINSRFRRITRFSGHKNITETMDSIKLVISIVIVMDGSN